MFDDVQDNVLIAKRKLFESVFKGKGKEVAAGNVRIYEM